MTRKAYWIGTTAVAVVMGLSQFTLAANQQLTDSASDLWVRYGSTNTGAYSSADPRSGVFQMMRQSGAHPILDVVQLTYFYRTPGSGGNQEINALTLANVDVGANAIGLTYQKTSGNPADENFRVFVTYQLTGSAPGVHANTVSRSVTVVNDSTSALTGFSLIGYNDLTLTGVIQPPQANPGWTAPGDAYSKLADFSEFAEIKTVGGAVKVRQWDIWNAPGGSGMVTDSEFVPLGPSNHNGGKPDRVELSIVGNGGSSLLSRLAGGAYNLNGTTKLVDANNNLLSGDYEYAVQYDFNLAAAGSIGSIFQVVETTQVIPEPATLGLLALGAGLLAMPRRRRR